MKNNVTELFPKEKLENDCIEICIGKRPFSMWSIPQTEKRYIKNETSEIYQFKNEEFTLYAKKPLSYEADILQDIIGYKMAEIGGYKNKKIQLKINMTFNEYCKLRGITNKDKKTEIRNNLVNAIFELIDNKIIWIKKDKYKSTDVLFSNILQEGKLSKNNIEIILTERYARYLQNGYIILFDKKLLSLDGRNKYSRIIGKILRNIYFSVKIRIDNNYNVIQIKTLLKYLYDLPTKYEEQENGRHYHRNIIHRVINSLNILKKYEIIQSYKLQKKENNTCHFLTQDEIDNIRYEEFINLYLTWEMTEPTYFAEYLENLKQKVLTKNTPK